MLKKLKRNPIFKNILIFFSGSLIALVLSALIQFFLPKVLSVSNYGLYKSFALYLSYTSLFHFGFKDGIYLALCSEKKFDKDKNTSYFTVLVIQQFLVLCLMLLASTFFEFSIKVVLFCLAIASFFLIISTYYDSLFQSQKEFKVVSFMKIIKELIFLGLLILIYFQFDDPDINVILSAFLISVFFVFIFYSIRARKFIGFKNFNLIKFNDIGLVYKRGLLLIAGNFGSQINTNVDKLFISFLYPVQLFAYYSFGGMFFVLTNAFVNSIATVLLPYLFDEFKDDLVRKYNQLMKFTTIFSIILALYLIGVFYFITFFYQEYNRSISIIALFFLGMVYSVKINIVQNNYLKFLSLDNQYVKNNYFVLLLFVLIMILLYLFDLEITYFALCTSLMIYVRYRLNLKSIDRKLKINKHYLADDSLIFTLGGLVFIYAEYLI